MNQVDNNKGLHSSNEENQQYTTQHSFTSGTASFSNCVFKSCESSTDGGAIYAKGASTSSLVEKLEINNCVFESCTSKAGHGGAIYSAYTNNIKITDSKYSSCKASGTSRAPKAWDASGGCVLIYSYSSQCILTGSTFSNGWATEDGGGVYIHTTAGNGLPPSLSSCSFLSCRCMAETDGAIGGGMCLYCVKAGPYSSLSFISCQATGVENSAGGGLAEQPTQGKHNGVQLKYLFFSGNVARIAHDFSLTNSPQSNPLDKDTCFTTDSGTYRVCSSTAYTNAALNTFEDHSTGDDAWITYVGSVTERLAEEEAEISDLDSKVAKLTTDLGDYTGAGLQGQINTISNFVGTSDSGLVKNLHDSRRF